MIGIDHSRAGIDVRCVFSFTSRLKEEALLEIKAQPGIAGCVMISTCNRMELYVSSGPGEEIDLVEPLCRIRGVDTEQYREYFAGRREAEAVAHLFSLASGLESRILGEDQIITQVKDALSFARERYVTDNVLEVLFRTAVTGAKKVKTEVKLSTANQSVIHHAIDELRREGYSFAGKTCMVIGNGAMGKLAATAVHQAGADVTVTVRQYRSGIVDIPRECSRINYGDRMELFYRCDLVVSATSSPNYTLRTEQIEPEKLQKPMILIDLAVPRDIEPGIGAIEGIALYDIDHYQLDIQSQQLKDNIARAKEILAEKQEEFFSWYECRDVIEKIQQIKTDAATDLGLRMERLIRELPMEREAQEEFSRQMQQAAGKVVNKLLFGLRDGVPAAEFRTCVEALEGVYQE